MSSVRDYGSVLVRDDGGWDQPAGGMRGTAEGGFQIDFAAEPIAPGGWLEVSSFGSFGWNNSVEGGAVLESGHGMLEEEQRRAVLSKA